MQSDLDENSTSFTVQLESGELESVTPSDITLGFNKLLVGNEILQFQDQLLLSENSYSVGTLVARGLRGTENYINSHAIGERVVLLTGTDAVIERIPLSATDIGQVRYFKALSPGQTLEEVNTITVTIQGNSLKPYAPVNLAATVDNVGNITITWNRRDRHAGERTDYTNFPLSESQEKWEIDVLAEATVVRTISSFDTKLIYSVTDQIGDFGSVQSSVTVIVYQISSDVGRGYPATATLTPTFQESTPIITGFNPMAGVEGDTVTVFGSGLAGVMAINLAGVPGNNIAVVSDYEISFIIAPDTVSGLIEVVTPGGSSSSSQSFVINSDSGSGFTGFVTVNSSRSLQDSDLGGLLNCDTNSGDITLTLDESLLTVSNFNCKVFNNGMGQVIFATSSTFLSPVTELTTPNSSRSLFYQPSVAWYAV